jgi:hypothetical protein
MNLLRGGSNEMKMISARPPKTMRIENRSLPCLPAILAMLVVAGCPVDRSGFGLAGVDASSAGGASTAGTGGRAAVGSGGAGVAAGGTGGGDPGLGGEVGSGGSGSGGEPGTGGRFIGTGGHADDGGASGGSGGSGASAGPGGQGGVPADGTCNATTCPTGCCMGNVCRNGRNDQRCGTAGAACAPCPSCYQCSNTGVCGLDPDAVWDVICSSATISASMPSNVNSAWDTDTTGVGTLPDPFCQFTRNGDAQMATTTLMNTLAPVWNQSIAPTNVDLTESFLTSDPWEVTVVDDDFGVTANDLACSIAPQLTAADFAAGTVALPPTRRCTALTIKLVCAQ